MCSRQSSSSYTSRKKPPYIASHCKGRRLLGNDGRLYKSTKARSGTSWRWQRDDASRSKKSRRKTKQCTRKRSPSYTRRNAPPYNASHCKGHRRLGNDGRAYKSKKTRSGAYRWKREYASTSRRRSATTRAPSGVLLQRLHPAIQRRFSEPPVTYKEILRRPVNPYITFGSDKNRQLYRYVFWELAKTRLPRNPSSVIKHIKDVKRRGMDDVDDLPGRVSEKWWATLYSDIPKIMEYYRFKSWT